MAKSAQETYDEFLDTFKIEVMQILKKTLPAQIMELTKLIGSEQFALSRKEEFRSATFDIPLLNHKNPEAQKEKPCKCCCGLRPLATHEMIVENKTMKEVWQLLCPHLMDLAEITNHFRTWLSLHGPRLEEGDNIGVEIQEKVMSALMEIEKSCFEDIEGYRLYNRKRGDSVEQVLKFPNVEDYFEEIRQLDEMFFLHIRYKLVDTRRLCIVVQDTVTKNMKKLIKPKTVEVESLYSM